MKNKQKKNPTKLQEPKPKDSSIMIQLTELPWDCLNQVTLSSDWMCIHYRTKPVKNWCRQMCWHLTFVFWADLWESCLSFFFYYFLIEMFWFFFPNTCVCFILLNLNEVLWFLILFVLLFGQRASGELGEIFWRLNRFPHSVSFLTKA